VPDKGWERRFAERFALAYAAACVAIKAGILPWTRQQALDAIAACYHDARGAVPDTAAQLAKVLARIRRTLTAKRKLVDLRQPGRASVKQLQRAHGFIKYAKGGGVLYVLKRQAFERLVAPLPAELVLRHLQEKGTCRPSNAVAYGNRYW
jgi:hypothetical protein